jgi:squalene-associated FAD-dependent desaturase
MQRRRVTVVGGGLAGITAALRCADAGFQVTLHEARPRLGGLTYSFRRRLTSEVGAGPDALWVDNGQHVFLRCCVAYRALLERLGVAHLTTTQRRLDIPVRADDGRLTHLRRGPLPAPLHLAGSLLRHPALTPAQRLRALGAARALGAVDATSPDADAATFGSWLRAKGQGRQAVAFLWDLVGVAALNARAEEASLGLAAMVFQQGLLRDASAGDVGWATVPLQQLHGDAAARALSAAGSEVRLRSRAEALVPDGDRWLVVTPAGVEPCDQVVVATPPRVTEHLLPPQALTQDRGWSSALGASPIVNLHLLVDRPVLDGPFVVGLSEPASTTTRPEYLWVFDRTRQAGLAGSRLQYLAVSLSAADHLVDLPTPVLRQRFLPLLTGMLEMPDSSVLDFFVTREREATFRPSPGTASLRPHAATNLPGLFVAGAWTSTGWPATMEGAVRSGDAAASALLGSSPLEVAAPGQVVA